MRGGEAGPTVEKSGVRSESNSSSARRTAGVAGGARREPCAPKGTAVPLDCTLYRLDGNSGAIGGAIGPAGDGTIGGQDGSGLRAAAAGGGGRKNCGAGVACGVGTGEGAGVGGGSRPLTNELNAAEAAEWRKERNRAAQRAAKGERRSSRAATAGSRLAGGGGLGAASAEQGGSPSEPRVNSAARQRVGLRQSSQPGCSRSASVRRKRRAGVTLVQARLGRIARRQGSADCGAARAAGRSAQEGGGGAKRGAPAGRSSATSDRTVAFGMCRRGAGLLEGF